MLVLIVNFTDLPAHGIGDSGGPLMLVTAPNGIIDNGTPELDYLVGIVSFGPMPCGAQGIPGVYTRVSSFSEWIINVTAPIGLTKVRANLQ